MIIAGNHAKNHVDYGLELSFFAASSLSMIERAVSVELHAQNRQPEATLKPTAIIVIVAQVPVTLSSQNPFEVKYT